MLALNFSCVCVLSPPIFQFSGIGCPAVMLFISSKMNLVIIAPNALYASRGIPSAPIDFYFLDCLEQWLPPPPYMVWSAIALYLGVLALRSGVWSSGVFVRVLPVCIVRPALRFLVL